MVLTLSVLSTTTRLISAIHPTISSTTLFTWYTFICRLFVPFFLLLTVPMCHHRLHWQPCVARASALCSPGELLGSRYPSSMHSNYPDTSVVDVPSLIPCTFPVTTKFSRLSILMTWYSKLSLLRIYIVFIQRVLYSCCPQYFQITFLLLSISFYAISFYALKV